MKLLVLGLFVTFSAVIDAYYSVDGNLSPNPGLPWNPLSPIRPTNNANALSDSTLREISLSLLKCLTTYLSGPPEKNSFPYPYGSVPYGNQIQWPYGYGPYGSINNNVGGTYGGLSNWPYQSQNWLPWRPLIPQPKPIEEKKNVSGNVVEVPIETAVEGLPGEKPFPQSKK
ncbi:hypothetical protein QR680_014422 [Steinernema hermaphroditum]|uniref:Uncharacterized protein n=1 Tax=Steinernema hermaphroditum TaxID=289476 RepID=A0AA39I8T8_9BILA|nr:hypothetical protein QR680_014422 [Steinernema hermaphroditum]